MSFMILLYDVFQQNTGKIFSPDGSVNIFSKDEKFSDSSNVVQVKTEAELEQLRIDVSTKPTMLHVTCGKHVPHGQR